MEWRFRKLENGCINIVKKRKHTLWDECESLEFNVFNMCNYIDPIGRNRLDDFDRYKTSVFIAAKDANYQLKGALRLIFNDSNDMQQSYFPTIDNALIVERTSLMKTNGKGNKLIIFRDMYEEMSNLAASECLDFATMAILPRHRDYRTSVALISRAIFEGWERSVRYGLSAVHTPLYIKFKQRGLPFRSLGPSVQYWGSPTTPGIMDMYAIPKKWRKLLIPAMWLKGMIGGKV